MNNHFENTPPLPQVESPILILPNSDRAPELETSAIRLQASKQAIKSANQNHHAPLSPNAPYIYAEEGLICIENQGRLPTTKCFFTNDFADKVIRVPLRDSKNPSTWWGKRPRLKIGVTKGELRKIREKNAATWCAVASAAGFLSFGTWGTLQGISPVLTLTSYTLGSALILVSGYFRASIQMSAPVVGKAFTVVKGAHPEFLEQFDQYENRKLVEDDYLTVSAQIEQFLGNLRFSQSESETAQEG